MACLYVQTNSGKRYHLERKLRNAQQGNDSSHAFYVKMTTLWDQLSFMEPQFTSAANSATFETYRQETRLVKFLMALRPEYEHVRSMLLHPSPPPSVDMALSELLSGEQTQSSLSTKRTTDGGYVLVSTSPTTQPRLLGPPHYKGGPPDISNYLKNKGH